MAHQHPQARAKEVPVLDVTLTGAEEIFLVYHTRQRVSLTKAALNGASVASDS
jgi:hypothetical protein